MPQAEKSFYQLTPDKVLDAIEAIGVRCTGRSLALNSMENRVYEVEIEVDESAIESRAERYRVAKFYRPGRWSKAQIQDEHDFLRELAAQDIPAVAPISFPEGETIAEFEDTGIFYTIFPKVQGRNLDELSDAQLLQIGRLVARTHLVGAGTVASHRLKLTTETYARESISFLESADVVPQVMRDGLFSVAKRLSDLIEPRFEGVDVQHIHGDCHVGNVLWRDEFCFLVDFDDFLTGPPVQDIWLLTPGRDELSLKAREKLLEGYQQLRDFDKRSLDLIEPLRTLRIIYFCGWIAKRYEDPSFQRTFPDFTSEPYWRDIIITLQEQEQIIQYGSVF